MWPAMENPTIRENVTCYDQSKLKDVDIKSCRF